MALTLFQVTQLDANQCLEHAYDETIQGFRVNAKIDTSGGDIEVALDHTEDSIRLGDGIDYFTSTVDTGKRALDVFAIGGTFESSFSGASGDLFSRQIPITDAPTPIVALTDQDSQSIRVIGAVPVWFGDATIIAGDTGNGYPKFKREEMVLDVTDASPVLVYGRCEAGKASRVAVIQLSN